MNTDEFFYNTMKSLGISGWDLHIVSNSREGFCWHDRRRIDIGENSPNPKRLVLHEIAHVLTPSLRDPHSRRFWRTHARLMRRFLPEMWFSESDVIIMQIRHIDPHEMLTKPTVRK